MKIRHPLPLCAAAALTLAMLACNIPGGAGKQPAAATDQPATSGSSQPTSQLATATDQPATSGSSQPTSQPAAASGPCANPLMPVVAGASWTYKTTITGLKDGTLTRSVKTVSDTGFTSQDSLGSLTTSADWKCDAGALIALQPTGGTTATASDANATADLKTTSLDGVTLPASVATGTAWSQTFKLEGNMTIHGTQIPTQEKVNQKCTAGPTESVTVPAGTFNAIRADCDIKIDITMTISGASTPSSIDSQVQIWYAPNVGMVKTSSQVTGMTTTLELTSYTIP